MPFRILKRKEKVAMDATPTVMETVIAAMSDVFDLTGTIVTQITSQPILLFCLAAGMVPIGISIFRRLKGAARG